MPTSCAATGRGCRTAARCRSRSRSRCGATSSGCASTGSVSRGWSTSCSRRAERPVTRFGPGLVRVLLTGMSGAGKSALVAELRGRGCAAYDADDDGFTEPRPHGGWGWRTDRVAALLAGTAGSTVFFAGCSEEQALFDFDVTVLLTAPEAVLVDRLRTRTSNSYGKRADELQRVLIE